MKNLFRRSIAMLLMLAMLSGLIGPGNVMLLTAYAEEESVETLELPTDVPEMEEIPEIVEAPAEPTEDVSLPAEPVQSGEETPAQETAGGSEPETPEESEGETGITENTGEALDENNAEPAALAEGEFWIHPVNAEGAEIETVLLHLTGLFPADAQVLVYAQGLTAVENAVEAYHVSILSGGQPWQPVSSPITVQLYSAAVSAAMAEGLLPAVWEVRYPVDAAEPLCLPYGELAVVDETGALCFDAWYFEILEIAMIAAAPVEAPAAEPVTEPDAGLITEVEVVPENVEEPAEEVTEEVTEEITEETAEETAEQVAEETNGAEIPDEVTDAVELEENTLAAPVSGKLERMVDGLAASLTAVIGSTVPFDFEDQGQTVAIGVTGTCQKNQMPEVRAASVQGDETRRVLEAWTVDNLKKKASLTLTAAVTALPELNAGESLAVCVVSGDALGETLRENLTVGDTVELPLAMKGPTGIAVVAVAAAEDPDDETVIPDNVIWANDDLYLTGKMPKNAVVEAEPVSVTIDGEDVLAAWDIKIYANENQRRKGKTWQPAGDKVQVHMRSDAFLGTSGELNVYHLADAGSAAEYVDSVTASDSWVEFDAASFSAYAISTVLEKTITATDGNTYKVTVTYDSASGIPAGAALAVSEITDPAAYRAYLDSAAETLSVSLENLTYTRLFDISVVGPDGQSYQPNDAVSVTVELMEPEARSVDDMRVVHFGSTAEKFTDEAASANALRAARFGGAAEELAAETANGTVTFKTEGFSVFSFLDTSVIDRVVGAIFGTSSKLYENDDIILTGRMPLLGTVEAAPVTVELEGKNVLLAYDIKIYANSLMKLLGIAWQPSEGAITVQVKSDVLTDGSKLSVYHMKDVKAKAEFVADVIAENSSVTFEADSFSVYPVTGEDAHRIFYTFYNGSKVLAQEYITKIQEFYDPGVSPEYGQTFLGWAYNSAETDESNMRTWEQLKTDLQALLNAGGYKDGEEVNVYAKFKEAYYLRYMVMEDDGTVGVLKSESVRTDAAGKTKTVNCEYSAVGSDFEGWIDAATGTSYQNGEMITLDHHIDLYAKLTGRYWLVFNSNTTGATFTGPQLIFGGTVTAKPADPTKKGYNFVGWNTKADGSGEWWYKADGSVTSRFGGTITADTTLYAQWEGAPNTYTIVYMKQAASDDVGLENSAKHYEYVESQTVTGVKTGDEITLPAGYNTKGTTTDTNSAYYQMQYSWTDWESGMTVGANGDTVVKVYYDRKDYHLYFQVYGYTYTPTTSNNGTQYGLIDGKYVQLSRRNNRWQYDATPDAIYYTWTDYTGTRYTRSNNQSWHTIKDIHALYGHDISDQFPIVGDNGVSYDTYRWDPQNDSVWKQIMVYVDSMPDRDVTFHGNGPSTPSKFMRYYVEVLPGETGTLSYNGVQYIQHGETYSAAYNYVSIEDRLPITGFAEGDAIGGTTATSDTQLSVYSGTALNSSNNSINVSNAYVYTSGWYRYVATWVNFLYTRNRHQIDFKSVGAHVTENQTQTVENVPYGAKITDYVPENPTNGMDGYYFAGWFLDEECQVPLTDTETMPDSNKVVYAKWDTYRVRVVLEPGCTDFWFANNQTTRFRLDYGEAVSGGNINPNVAKRPGYKLTGWYYTPDFQAGTEVNFGEEGYRITNSTPGVNMNYQSTDDWTNNTYGDNDGEHENVKGILKLYAKWQLDLKEGAIYFLYEVEDGYCIFDSSGYNQTVIPVDPTAYAYGSNVTIAEAPSNYSSGVEFVDWMVLNKNGGTTSVKHPAGQSLTLTEDAWAEYVDVIPISDEGGNIYSMHVIRLRARFNAKEDMATSITFYGNGGAMSGGATSTTKVVPVNATVELSEQSAAFTREHYTIIGWNTEADGSGTSFSTDEALYADNEGLQEGESNALYAMWLPDIEIVATGPEEVAIYDGESHSTTQPYTFTYTLGGEEMTEAQLNAMGIYVTIASTGWPTATGTEKGVYTAAELSDETLASMITINSTAYHGEYTIKRVYHPAKLTIRDLLLTITKTVTGDFGDQNKPFTFTLVSVEGMSSGSFPITITHVFEGTTTTGTIAIGGTFWMRHGDTVAIEGLPKGKDVMFQEDNGVYKTTWKLDEETAVPGNTTTIKLADDATLAVVNDYPPPAPTGADFDVGPFLVLLGFGLGLLALLLMPKLLLNAASEADADSRTAHKSLSIIDGLLDRSNDTIQKKIRKTVSGKPKHEGAPKDGKCPDGPGSGEVR